MLKVNGLLLVMGQCYKCHTARNKLLCTAFLSSSVRSLVVAMAAAEDVPDGVQCHPCVACVGGGCRCGLVTT